MKNLKNFGITFAVSFVILGIIALIACGFVADTVCGIFNGGDAVDVNPDETAQKSDDDDRMNRKLDGESFTWLWVVSDYRPNVFDDYYPTSEKEVKGLKDFGALGESYRLPAASNIVLVRANVDSREYLLVNIPAMTKIETSAGEYTLGEYYAVSGISGLNEKVEAMTGFTVDYYSVIHSTDLSVLANIVGSIECKIPVDIYTDGQKYVSAPAEETTSAKLNGSKNKAATNAAETTAAKKVTLTNELDRSDSVKLANKLMAALLYFDESDGITQEMTIEQSFAKGLMTNISDCSDSTLQSYVKALSSVFVASNLNDEAVALNGEVIRAYTWFEIHSMTYPGKLVPAKGNSSTYYKADFQQGAKYFYNYR